jgi:Flp pilus assembly protein TadD
LSEAAVPRPTEAKLNQALGCLRSHLVNPAEISLREVLAAQPGDLTAQQPHGIALFKLGRRGQGIAAIAAAVELDLSGASFWLRVV